ncbi:amidohydrolase [Streptomyces zagrosensis]|uniref:Amidohydrolase n=1 Tax=Streptomyces zagrosensis TaxID=1042984 RepID=A0A7W9Q512_9ACTN|nr:amidohydrolase [Streptomyces zagrosensis]MBB5933625.1 hypothetical protein [Streptomyces zagrosensis]
MLLDGPERRRPSPPGPRPAGWAQGGGAGEAPWGEPGCEPGPIAAEDRGFALPPLVDQHGLGVSHGELGLGSFESLLATAGGSHGAAPPGTTFFDTWTGLAVRRWCPPLLGLEAHCTPVRYLAARRELGAYRATRLLLRGCGIGAYLLETGTAAELTSAHELASAADAPAHEIVRLEPLAEQVADTSGTVGDFLGNTAEALYTAARYAVAFACAPGLGDAQPPDAPTVRRAADRWLGTRTRGAGLDDPVLLRHLMWNAVATGLPVQLHCPQPEQIATFLAATAGLGTDLVLLPGHGGHERAARFAAVFPHVYADVGPAPQETLRQAPFGKLLFSTGARALPELYVVAACLFAERMAQLAREWAAEGVCTEPEAWRIASLVAAGTARRVYRLAAGAGSSSAG